MAKSIDLEERKQFRVLLHPVRQDILHLLRRVGRPMTANRVAEKMQLSPISAQGHLKKLTDMGLVLAEEHPTKRGGKAVCYSLADVEIRLRLGKKDMFQGEREALAANLVDGTFRGLIDVTRQHDEAQMDENGLLLFGALHLPPQERAELMGMIRNYLKSHTTPEEENVEHWEYVVMAYRATEN